MNKFFTKIAGLTLGLAMAIGVGVAVGSRDIKTASAADTWEKTTTLTAGDVVVLSGTSNNKYREMTSVGSYGAVANESTTIAGTYQLTVVAGAESDSYAFKDSNNKYLYYSGSGNSLGLSSDLNSSSSWTITVADSSAKSVRLYNANSSYSTRRLVYNSSSPRLACYTTDQTAIYMLKKTSSGTTTTYTMSYDANGGTGTTTDANSPYTSGSKATIVDNSFTAPSGKEFHHWNTAADNSGTTYYPGDELTVSGSVSLNAIWTDIASGDGSITFSDNGGTGDSNTEITSPDVLWNYLSTGGAYVKNFSSLSKLYKGVTGLKFGGGSSTGSLTINFASSKSSGLNGKMVYATFKSYGTDTGNLNFTSSSLNGGETISLPKSDISNYTEFEVGVFESSPTALTIATSTKRAYLKSIRFADAPTEYTVTYDTAGGNEIAPAQVTIGESIETLPTPTKEGYYFLGWKLLSSGVPTGDYLTSPYTPSGNVTLQAQWTSNTLHITYNANGATSGEAPTDNTVYGYNSSVTVVGAGSMKKTHNSFGGWNTKSDGTGTAYAVGSSYTITADSTLYAVWNVNAVTSLINVDSSVPTKTKYSAGEEFDPTGLVIHAVYANEGEDQENISSLISWGELVKDATSVTGSFGGQSITINGLTISAAKGSQDNPYTVLEARAVADALGSSTSTATTESYTKGYVSAVADETYNSKYGNKTFWITDSGADDETIELEIYRAYYTDSSTLMTEDQFNSIDIGDEVIICGKLKKYVSGSNVTLEVDQTCYLSSHTQETREISLSLSSDTKTVNSAFSYSGTVSTAFTIRQNSDVTSSVTFTGYDMTSVGQQTVTVTYHDVLWDMDITKTYTLNVQYAAVSSVTINGPSSIELAQKDSHTFTATLNKDTDPGSVITWTATDSVGTLVQSGNASINTSGIFTVDTVSTGTILVRASCGGVTSDPVTVNITGNPIPTLSTNSVEGFVGGNTTVSVAGVSGGVAPYTYKWTITGASGIIEIDSSTGDLSSTAKINYIGNGTSELTLTVTDSANKVGSASVSAEIIKSLNPISYVEPDSWALVTDLSQLSKDTQIIFVGSNTVNNVTTNYGMSTWASGNNNVRASSHKEGSSTVYNTLTISNGYITDGVTDDMIYTLDTDADCGTNVYAFKDSTSDGGKYLYAPNAKNSTNSNHLKSQSSIDELSRFEISLSESVFTIKVVGTTNRGYFGFNYNNGSPMYACYKSDVDQANTAKIYYKIPGSSGDIANTNFNAQKALIEFSESLNSKLDAVCLKSEGGTTDLEALDAKWTEIESIYTSKRNSLSAPDRIIFDAMIANGGKSENGDSLEKALSSYDYVYKKYHASLTSGDFLNENSGRAAVQYSSINNILAINMKNTSATIIVVVISAISAAAIGGYFLFRKKKED